MELKRLRVKLIFQLKKKPIESTRMMMPMMMIKFLLKNFWSNLEREKLKKREKKPKLPPPLKQLLLKRTKLQELMKKLKQLHS